MIVIDIETTGTNAVKHSIVSIGAIDTLTKETFYKECRIWNGAHIEKESLDINDITEEELRDSTKITEEQLVSEFLRWVSKSRDHTIAGHNPSFDLGFLEMACNRYEMNYPLAHRSIDQHSVCIAHMAMRGIEYQTENNRTSINSDYIMEYVGLPLEPKPHNALNGAIWQAEALFRMLYNKNLLPEFSKYKIPF